MTIPARAKEDGQKDDKKMLRRWRREWVGSYVENTVEEGIKSSDIKQTTVETRCATLETRMRKSDDVKREAGGREEGRGDLEALDGPGDSLREKEIEGAPGERNVFEAGDDQVFVSSLERRAE